MTKHSLAQETHEPKDTVFMVYYSTLPLEDFIALLETWHRMPCRYQQGASLAP